MSKRLNCCVLERETSGDGILVKHTDRIERQFIKVFASEFDQFSKNIVGDSDDMAAACSRLEDIKYLTNAGPEKFSFGQTPQYLERLLHNRQWIDSSIGDAPGEN